ncbi:MAG: DUF1015 domain-containing protein [Oscillospiraceae bacterium]|nr:DUF1015 domain-containing protein [Oscillospiraceae bacterium]
MDKLFEMIPFKPADILLPHDCDMSRWSVVACDQYTSQPEYWQRVADYVGRSPSTLNLVLPESCLEGPNVETDIMEINNTMSRYLRDGCFDVFPGALIYVERQLHGGKTRRGIVGMVDLDQYDYEPGSPALVRATEGTVLSRIPPRVAVRKNALIELPHVMLLCDDRESTVMQPLSALTGEMEKVYDFELMEQGGHITGWLMTDKHQQLLSEALCKLGDPAAFRAKYGVGEDVSVMLFAVGDGNHSLATAKECYERQKRLVPPEQWADLPARYALVELCDLHDESLQFEPIHRVVFGVKPEQLLADLMNALPGAYEGEGEGHSFSYITRSGKGTVTVPNPAAQLAVGTLQNFLDDWLLNHPGAGIDYIHGEDVVEELSQRADAVGFLLPAMGKEELFPTVIHDGVLPRKTFSMGHANDKRFYLEARKIR